MPNTHCFIGQVCILLKPQTNETFPPHNFYNPTIQLMQNFGFATPLLV